jgi:hypothetical protein
MTLTWQPLGIVNIPAHPVGYWTLASEFVPGSRLLRIHTLTADHRARAAPVVWNAVPGNPCGPDGAPSPRPNVTDAPTGPSGNPSSIVKATMLCNSAAYGALIGKIGGSTADLPDLTPGVTTPYGNKRAFAVGSDAIIALPAATDGGPLFLTMNDKPEEFPKHSGEIQVYLEYYPL